MDTRHQKRIEDAVINHAGFYYVATTHALDPRFSRTGTQWVFSQVVKGKAEQFRAVTNQSEKKEKTIIVSDFSLNELAKENETQALRSAIAEIIRVLIRKGFTVKFWEGNHLLDVKEASESSWPQIAPLKSADLTKIKEKYTGSTLVHLDYFATRALLHQLDIWPESAAALVAPENTIYLEEVYNNGNIISAPVLHWLDDTPSFGVYHRFNKVKVAIKDFILIFPEQITGVHFFQVTDATLFKQVLALKHLKELSWYDISETKKKMAELRFTLAEHAITEEEASKGSDEIRERIIETKRNYAHSYQLGSEFKFPTLTSLNIHDGLIFSEMVPHLIKQADQLREIDTARHNETDHDFTDKSISGQDMAKILEAANRLSKLTLSKSIHKLDDIRVLPASLKSLKLSFSSQVPGTHILNLTSNIEELIITDIFEFDRPSPDLLSNPAAFANLRSLSATNKHNERPNIKTLGISLAAFLKIHSMAKQLSAIAFDGFDLTEENDDSIKQLDKIDLQHIASLRFNKTNFKHTIFFRLLSLMPNLVSIEIEDSSDIYFTASIAFEVIELLSAGLAKLRTLSCKNSSVSSGFLPLIMSRAENLETVETTAPPNNYGNLFYIRPDTFDEKKNRWDQLSQFTPWGIIRLCDYYFILRLSPKLTVLDLSCIRTVDSWAWKLPDSPQTLEQVKTLIIDGRYQCIDSLKNILPLLPNLEKIISIAVKDPRHCIEKINLYKVPEALSLPRLRVADFGQIDISGKAVAKILAASKERVELTIHEENSLADLTPDLLPSPLNVKLTSTSLKKLPLETYLRLVAASGNALTLPLVDTFTDKKLSSNLMLPSITSIKSESNHYENEIPGILLACRNLEEIDLTAPAYLWMLGSLTYKITTGFSQLSKLRLSNVTIDAQLFNGFAEHAPSLTTLVMDHITINNLPLSGTNPRIHSLTIKNQPLSKDFIIALRKAFPNLTDLKLVNCRGLADCDEVGLEMLGEWPSLTTLYVDKCDININGMKQLLLKSTQLVSIEFIDCENLKGYLKFSDNEAANLGSSLDKFVIRYTRELSEEISTTILTSAITWLLTRNRRLTELKLPYCYLAVDRTVNTEHTGQLATIDFYSAWMPFNLFISILSRNDNSLRTLYLDMLKFLVVTPDCAVTNHTFSAPESIQVLSHEHSQLPLNLILTLARDQQKLTLCGFDSASRKTIELLPTQTEARELVMERCNLSLDDFLTILVNTPHVISIQLKFCVISSTVPDLDKISLLMNKVKLTHVRNMTLDIFDFSPNILDFSPFTFNFLLKNLINIESITLKSRVGTGVAEYVKVLSRYRFPKLSRLVLDDKFLQTQFKLSLRQLAPNLKELNGIPYDRATRTSPSTVTAQPKPVDVSASAPSLIPAPTLISQDSTNFNSRYTQSDLSKDAATDPAPGDEVSRRQLFFPCTKDNLLSDICTYRLAICSDIKFDGKKIIPVKASFVEHSSKATNIWRLTAGSFTAEFEKLHRSDPDHYRYFEDRDHTFRITTEWKPLPSKLIHETMTHFCTDYAHPYQIKYCSVNHLYYIRGDVDQDAIIKFILQLKPRTEALYLPKEIIDLYNHCKDFHAAEDGLAPTAHLDAEQILEWRYQHQIGSCENRSLVFLHKMKQRGWLEKYPCRIIYNDPHAFIEIQDEHGFGLLDLGGYPAAQDDMLPELTASYSEEPDEHIEPAPQQYSEQPEMLEIEEDDASDESRGDPSEQKRAPRDDKPAMPQSDKLPNISEESLHPALITWHKETPAKSSMESIFTAMMQPEKNTLINVENDDDCLKIIAAFSKQHKTPYLVIDSADDLQWSAAGMKAHKTLKLSIKQKFSMLRYFVKHYPEGVIFINWSRFLPADIVALHTILDEKRMLEGEPFSAKNPIVNFNNTKKPNAYLGTDLDSRTHEKITWQHPLADDVYSERCHPAATPTANALVIDLYNSDDWESLLFGQIYIKHQQFSLAHTAFLPAKGRDITIKQLHLKNAPRHLREFQLFWQSALQQRRFVYLGASYHLNDDFQLSYSDENNVDLSLIQEKVSPDAPVFVLNSQTFTDLFEHCVANTKNEFESIKGFFEVHAGATITLQVIEALSSSQWARLLTEAKKQHVKIALTLLPGVSLPAELGSVSYSILSKTPAEMPGCDVIYAKDNSKQTFLNLLAKYPKALPIEADKAHEFSDFFYSIATKVTDEGTLINKFINSDIWLALQEGRTILIEGEIPKVIISMLGELFVTGKQELMIQGRRVPFKGKLIFVTPHEIPCALHQLTAPATTTKAPSIKFRAIKPSAQTDQHDLSLTACEDYEKRRFDNLMTGMNQSALVFYTGTTGIGKSKYFEEDERGNSQFERDYEKHTGRRCKLYRGESQIEAYAMHSDPAVDAFPIIDEANLSSQRLSFIKSWQSGHLLTNGHYYTKQSYHKSFILIGNPNNYGGVRQQQAFFDEHTLQVECEKPTHAYLYHRVLKKQVDQNIARIFLEIYEHINNQSADKHKQIVTARHLGTIAKVFKVWLAQFKDAELAPEQLAIAAAIAILGDSISATVRDNLLVAMQTAYHYDPKRVKEAQNAVTKTMVEQLHADDDDFEFAASRYPVIQLLETFILLYEQYDSNELDFGILLEGESGIGKSDLVVNYFKKSRGIDLLQLSPGKNFEKDCEKLKEAKAQSRWTLLDEINAGGERYEQLINTLKLRLIATQNPAAMDGRQLLSPAVRARFAICNVPQYSTEELTQVIMRKCKLQHYLAAQLAHDFTTATQFAEQRNLSPKPNLRSFLKDIITGKIKPRIPDDIRIILGNTEFWRTQAAGSRCDIPVGISAMLAADSLEAMQDIARQRLGNSGFTFFSSLFRSSTTTEFYKLMLDPEESKLKDFIAHQTKVVSKLKSLDQQDDFAYPAVHILK